MLVSGKNAPKKTPSWRAWWPLSKTEPAVQRVIGRAAVPWARTVSKRTGSRGSAEREIHGVEVPRETVRRCASALCDFASADAIVVLLSSDEF